MTVTTTAGKINYTGNGSTTAFATNFKIYDEDHVEVYLDGVLKTITTHYTVSGIGGSTATVTFGTAPASAVIVSLRLAPPLDQQADYVNGEAFNLDTLEQSLDLAVQISQGIDEQLSRTVRAPVTAGSSFAGELGSLGAGYLLRVKSDELGFETVSPSDAALGVTVNPADGNFLVGDGTEFVAESGATVRASMGLGSIATQDSSAVNLTGGTISGLSSLAVDGDITVTGTVDSVDVAALKTDVDGFPDALKNLTTAEIGELENIGTSTISSSQWGFLGAITAQPLEEVSDDTSPTLGGDLDVGGNSIVSTSAGNISITPDTTGSVIIDGISHPQADGTSGQVLSTDGAGQLSFITPPSNVVGDTSPTLGGNLDVGGNSIISTAAGNISITPDTTGSVIIDGISHPQTDGTSGQVLTTNGSGQLSFATPAGGGSMNNVSDDTSPTLGGDLDVGGFSIISTTAGDISITPNTTGDVILDGQKWPQADGTANQKLKTNGAGQLSWVSSVYDMGFVAGFTSTMGAEDLVVQTYGEIVVPRAFSIVGESGYIGTVATGSAVILDIEKNGVTVYTTKPQFAVSTATLTAGTLKTNGTEDFAAGDRLTFKVTQKGSTIAGARVRFSIRGEL